jgi:hypothetical protein
LSALNKFSDVGEVDLSEVAQTNPQNSWLTAQSGLLTLYEVRINEDEFNYVFTNTLYDAQKQRDLAASDQGLSLPDGGSGSSQYGPVGAIELKAAWLELDDRKDWPRYKTAKARVTYPGQSPKVVTVGLVGLHIIHKTQSAQQFVWATFEHVDNDPDVDDKPDPGRTPPYTFFNPACDPQTDHYKCVVNAVPDKPCKSAGQPPGCDPYDAPVQVRRTTPIDDSPTNDIAGLNRAVHSMIAGANSDSVFRHYELVNVLWPDNSTTIAPKSQAPLTCGDPTPPPSQEIVSNTTIETYLQAGTGTGNASLPDPCNANATGLAGDTCLTCHVFAPVSSKKPEISPELVVGAQDLYASDYSFVLSKAFAAPAQEDDGTPVGWIALGLGGIAAAAAGAVLVRRRRSALGA